MQLTVTGANGLLGSNVVSRADARGWDVTGTYHSSAPALDAPLRRLDLRDEAAIERTLDETAPDAVVNAAAVTDVDACETEPEEARAVNAEAPGTLAAACEERGIRLLHVSTDYVFDGAATTPYAESADPNPIQEYGRTKLAGERAVQSAHERAAVARVSFLWGVHRGADELRGFPAWAAGRLAAGEAVPLVTDQHVSPTRAGAAADVALALLEREAAGCYHVAARTCTTPYELGDALRERLGASEALLEECRQSDLDRAAERPSYTCLDVGRVADAIDRELPTLADDLDAVEAWLPVADGASG